MASNEDTNASHSSRDADDEFTGPPNKVRKIFSSDSVESEVVANRSSENELTQEGRVSEEQTDDEEINDSVESEVVANRSSENELTQEGSGSEEQTCDEEINDRTPLKIEVSYSFWRNKTLCAMLWRKGVTSEPQAQPSRPNAVEVTAKTKAEENETLCDTQDADNTQTSVCVLSSDAMEVKAETNAEEYETLYARQDADNKIQGSSDAVKAEAERKPILIGLQLSTSASATPASYPLCVEENFRSNQVKWELKAFDSQRKETDWEIFKGADSRIEGKHYAELFPSTALTDTTSNGAEEDLCGVERGRCRQKSPAVLQVEVKRTTYREAAIEWSVEPSLSTAVDKWLVVIRNEGRTPSNSSDHKQTSEWMIIFKSQPSQVTYRIDSDLVKLEYQAGHKYSVQVIGLQRKHKDLPNNGVECYAVIAFSEKTFRAENTEDDYKQLLSKARQIRQHPNQSDSKMCHYLYRDKLSGYFNDLKANSNNVMEVYVKDANGDPASAIHGLLKGLFFSANVHFGSGQPMSSRFGDKGVLIPPEKLLTKDTNMYFGDFYCLNGNHLVTLVVTRSKSEADEFCREKKLPLLGRTKYENPFLYFSGGDSVFVSSQITVEVFYTENIDLKELSSRYGGQWRQSIGWRNRRQGDRWKNSGCLKCNLYTGEILDAFLV